MQGTSRPLSRTPGSPTPFTPAPPVLSPGQTQPAQRGRSSGGGPGPAPPPPPRARTCPRELEAHSRGIAQLSLSVRLPRQRESPTPPERSQVAGVWWAGRERGGRESCLRPPPEVRLLRPGLGGRPRLRPGGSRGDPGGPRGVRGGLGARAWSRRCRESSGGTARFRRSFSQSWG